MSQLEYRYHLRAYSLDVRRHKNQIVASSETEANSNAFFMVI